MSLRRAEGVALTFVGFDCPHGLTDGNSQVLSAPETKTYRWVFLLLKTKKTTTPKGYHLTYVSIGVSGG